MAKRLNYLISQGQGGVRSGISLGIPWKMDNNAAANGAIPAASYPIETAIWTVPDRITGDAFLPATYIDANPAANEPAVQAYIEAARVAFNAAFAAAAASFLVVLRAFTSAGALRGTIATLVDGTVTTLVAQAVIVIPRASMAQMPLNVGDVVTERITIQGAGAAVPAHGGTLDVQG